MGICDLVSFLQNKYWIWFFHHFLVTENGLVSSLKTILVPSLTSGSKRLNIVERKKRFSHISEPLLRASDDPIGQIVRLDPGFLITLFFNFHHSFRLIIADGNSEWEPSTSWEFLNLLSTFKLSLQVQHNHKSMTRGGTYCLVTIAPFFFTPPHTINPR